MTTLDEGDLYTITKSCVITTNQEARVWLCGAGGVGNEKHGGGGGYNNSLDKLPRGTYTVTIGAANRTANGGATSIVGGSVNLTAEGGKDGDGGSGGGASAKSTAPSTDYGKGDGKSCYPFGITSLYAHCAGSAGGSVTRGVLSPSPNLRGTWISSWKFADGKITSKKNGGNGGSNGQDGTAAGTGQGGEKGGPKDGNVANFYGAGSNTFWWYATDLDWSEFEKKGFSPLPDATIKEIDPLYPWQPISYAAYQGVCYILIPK